MARKKLNQLRVSYTSIDVLTVSVTLGQRLNHECQTHLKSTKDRGFVSPKIISLDNLSRRLATNGLTLIKFSSNLIKFQVRPCSAQCCVCRCYRGHSGHPEYKAMRDLIHNLQGLNSRNEPRNIEEPPQAHDFCSIGLL